MFAIQTVADVKLFVAVLWSDPESLRQALAALSEQWGDFDLMGADHRFDATDYYEAEMGSGLQRRLVGFIRLVSPEILAQAKRTCIQIEDRLSCAGERRVNLDVGYLDHNKIVLASIKAAGQKIYLSQGVYADLVARYREGRYRPFEWTFPDFRDGRYDEELGQLRRNYLQRRQCILEPNAD